MYMNLYWNLRGILSFKMHVEIVFNILIEIDKEFYWSFETEIEIVKGFL